jgi:hypothetical protein
MKACRSLLIAFSLIGSMALFPRPAWADAPADPSQTKPAVHDRVYYFEHKLLPAWVHKSEGAFYSDLGKGETKHLFEAATEVIGKDFSGGIKIRKIERLNGFLIAFPKPEEAPECFFAAVLKDGPQYHYVTLELSENFAGDGTKAFLCEWASNGDHLDYGPRKFADEAHFLAELEDRQKKGPDQVRPAARTSPMPPAPQDSPQT